MKIKLLYRNGHEKLLNFPDSEQLSDCISYHGSKFTFRYILADGGQVYGQQPGYQDIDDLVTEVQEPPCT